MVSELHLFDLETKNQITGLEAYEKE